MFHSSDLQRRVPRVVESFLQHFAFNSSARRRAGGAAALVNALQRGDGPTDLHLVLTLYAALLHGTATLGWTVDGQS